MTDSACGWAPSALADAGEAEDDGYVVYVRETIDDETWAMLFMDPYDAEDEQEIRRGMDTYCLVVEPGQLTCYGGVLACEIDGGEMLLRLSDDAARTLGVPAEMRFVLGFDAEKVQMLRRGLRRVLTSGRADAVPPHLSV